MKIDQKDDWSGSNDTFLFSVRLYCQVFHLLLVLNLSPLGLRKGSFNKKRWRNQILSPRQQTVELSHTWKLEKWHTRHSVALTFITFLQSESASSSHAFLLRTQPCELRKDLSKSACFQIRFTNAYANMWLLRFGGRLRKPVQSRWLLGENFEFDSNVCHLSSEYWFQTEQSDWIVVAPCLC